MTESVGQELTSSRAARGAELVSSVMCVLLQSMCLILLGWYGRWGGGLLFVFLAANLCLNRALASMAVAFYALGVLLVYPGVLHYGDYRRSLGICQGHFKEISTALEIYSCDYEGLYPGSLGLLVPRYLKKLPDCPSVFRETYSGGYLCSPDHKGYTVMCLGEHGAPRFPQYSSSCGLRVKP